MNSLPFDEQKPSGNQRPDFILPSLARLHLSTRSRDEALILSLKTTLRERWKQVVKDKSAREIKAAALVLEADFVFAIMEAWSLRPDKIPQMDAILDKYGSIGASPYAVDVCSLTLETRRGVWVAQPQIKPKGISKKKRTIGKVEFRYYTEVQGRFTHLLPMKEDDEPPTILH